MDVKKIKKALPGGLEIMDVHKLDDNSYLVMAAEKGASLLNTLDPYYEYSEKTGKISRFDVASNYDKYVKAMQSESLL